MKTYRVKLHTDDVTRIPMMRMGMEQDDSNDDADMICDILYQIENQAFDDLQKNKSYSEAWKKMESTNPEYRLE
jgi:hypothetical protein